MFRYQLLFRKFSIFHRISRLFPSFFESVSYVFVQCASFENHVCIRVVQKFGSCAVCCIYIYYNIYIVQILYNYIILHYINVINVKNVIININISFIQFDTALQSTVSTQNMCVCNIKQGTIKLHYCNNTIVCSSK